MSVVRAEINPRRFVGMPVFFASFMVAQAREQGIKFDGPERLFHLTEDDVQITPPWRMWEDFETGNVVIEQEQ